MIYENPNSIIRNVLSRILLDNIDVEKLIRISPKYFLYKSASYKRELIKEAREILRSGTYRMDFSSSCLFIELVRNKESDFDILKLAFSEKYSFQLIDFPERELLEQQINFLRNVK